MWMMGYNDGGELNLHDSFNGASRRLRPLVPRPNLPNPNTNNNSPTSNPPCFFAQYHHLASLGEQNKRELVNPSGTSPQVVVSSRWNPTPEQLRALEELYRRGTRTPSAEQIQHITAQLRRYGKIEGKNVFYWFQNHKARERQKRRRQMESSTARSPPHAGEDLERSKESGANRTVYEVEQTKNWPPSSNCSSTALSEESIQIRAAGAGNNNKVAGSLQASSDCVMRTDGWLPLAEGELQNRRLNNNMNFVERNSTWQILSYPPPNFLTHIINNATNNNSNSPSIRKTASSLITSAMDQRLVKPIGTAATPNHDRLSIFVSDQNGHINSHSNSSLGSQLEEQDYSNICSSSSEDSQTLELFPLRSGDEAALHGGERETHETLVSAMNSPRQFFEFLPLKN